MNYECPVCGEWVEILPTTNKDAFDCPWCKEPLALDVDYDNPGMSNQRDLSHLYSRRPHIERMIKHGRNLRQEMP